MKSFQYIIQDSTSAVKEGFLAAEDLDRAIGELQNRGSLILTISESTTQSYETSLSGILGLRPAPELLIPLVRDLRMLLKGGIPMLRGLHILSDKSSSRAINAAMSVVVKRVAAGGTLSGALGEHPRVFPPLMVSLVQVGEESGQLPAALGKYSAYLQRQIELKRKVVGALTYPAVVMVFALAVTVFICMRVVPTFAKIFAELNIPLPAVTSAVIVVSAFMVAYWPMLLLWAGGGALLTASYSATDDGRRTLWRVKRSAPPFNRLFQDAALEKFFSTFGLLMESGINVMQALKVLHGVFVEDPEFSEAIQSVEIQVAKGSTVSAAMSKSPLFPVVTTESISVSEEAGTVIDTLKNLGEGHGERLDAEARQIATLIEPFMIFGVGIVVGLIMFALFIPMLDLSGGIRPR